MTLSFASVMLLLLLLLPKLLQQARVREEVPWVIMPMKAMAAGHLLLLLMLLSLKRKVFCIQLRPTCTWLQCVTSYSLTNVPHAPIIMHLTAIDFP
jgi:hypothetical protein